MKKIIVKIYLYSILLLIGACDKYQDPPKSDLDERLENLYCNDPIAVNYNHGFPGIPNNDVCIYSIDPFVGKWIFVDTVLFPDSTIEKIDTLYFQINPYPGDTTLSRLTVEGWSCNETLYMIADRFGKAVTDTMVGGFKKQVLCQQQDTLSGIFQKKQEDSTVMSVNFEVNNLQGLRKHNGSAYKQ